MTLMATCSLFTISTLLSIVSHLVLAQYGTYNSYQPWSRYHRHRPQQLNWTDCGDESSIIRFNEIKLDRYPLRWGHPVHLTADVDILQDVYNGIRSVASIGPLPFTRDAEIPCLSDNFGSCNTDLCENVESTDLIICQFLQATGNPCSCPLKAGNYRADRLSIPIPPPPPLLQFFANRPFWTRWYWLDPDSGEAVGCLSADLIFSR